MGTLFFQIIIKTRVVTERLVCVDLDHYNSK